MCVCTLVFRKTCVQEKGEKCEGKGQSKQIKPDKVSLAEKEKNKFVRCHSRRRRRRRNDFPGIDGRETQATALCVRVCVFQRG